FQRRLVPGWRRLQAFAARRRPAARRRARPRRDGGDARRIPREARPDALPAGAAGHPRRPPAGRHLLRVGEPLRTAPAAQRRDGLLPRRAGAQGHHRAGRVLRREPGKTAQPARVALQELLALLLRPAPGASRPGARADRGVGRRGGARLGAPRAAALPERYFCGTEEEPWLVTSMVSAVGCPSTSW